MRIIKKALLETYLKENIDLNNAVRMNIEYTETLKLGKLYPELGELLGTMEPTTGPSFAMAVERYQARFSEFKEEDGIMGPFTLNHILKRNPVLLKKAGGSLVNNTKGLSNIKPEPASFTSFNLNKFKQAIADIESFGGRYDARNKNSSAVGKYQMLWDIWANKIREFAGNEKLTVEQYLANKILQEKFMDHYIKNVLQKETAKLVDRYPMALEKYNTSQLMALLHFKGWNGAREWILNGEDNTSANNTSIDNYLSKFT